MKRLEQQRAMQALYDALGRARIAPEELPAIREAVLALGTDCFNAGWEAAMEEVASVATLSRLARQGSPQ